MSVMAAEPHTAAVHQVVGTEGEVALGKEYAGRAVSVVMLEPGVWSVKVGTFVPDNERWLLDPKVQADLDEAIAWAERTPPQTTDLKDFEEKLLGGLPDDSGSPRSE
jgi:hypothetical protein